MSKPHHAQPWHARALATAIATGVLLSFGVVGPAAADEYPTWDDVMNARASEQSKQDAITEIEGYIAALETEAAELGRAAQARAEEYNAATIALEDAASRAKKLDEAAQEAADRAEESNSRAGQLAAYLARTGSGDLSMALVMAPDVEDMLGTLGTASKVAERAAQIYEQATIDRNRAESMTAQARVAEGERTKLSGAAEVALADAKAASDTVVARMADEQAASDQLYEQLATLKDSTTEIESGYMEGVTAEQEQAAQPPPPAPVGPAPNPTPAPPNSSAAAGAIAFAYAQLGKPYQFGGSGPNSWDCSGLTKAAYASVGVYIGAHLVSSQYYTMANAGRLVPLGAMAPGDLIYYADGGYPGSFYHVTMYVGGGMMVEAPREGVPVRVTPVRYYDALPYAGRPTG